MPVTHFDIELTNLCNASCKMCPRGSLRRPIGMMSKETMDSVIEKATSCGIKYFVFSGFGEPCLNNKLLSFVIKIKKETDIKIKLNTNGALLTGDLINDLLDSGLDAINFNINGANKSDYSRITKGIDFDNLLANIDYLAQRKSQKHSLIDIGVQAEFIGRSSLDDFLLYWFKKAVNKVTLHPCNNRAGYLNQGRFDGAVAFSDRYCKIILFIAWNGDVFFCSHDLEGAYKKGHISKMTQDWLVKEKIGLCDLCNLSNFKEYFNDSLG